MKRRAIVIAFVAFLGMVDTFYLSLKRNAGPIPCHVTQGCNDVLTSSYSVVFGVPLSWIGFAFYLVIFSLAVFNTFEDQEHTTGQQLRWIFYGSGLALLISALLVGIQAFILKAFCEYCLLSAAFVLTIFLVSPRPVLHTRPA